LRIAGATFQQIGDKLGMTKQGALYTIRTAMAKTNAEVETLGAELKELESQRLDALQAANWADAMKGDIQKGALILKIMARRAALFGLDAPTKQDITSAGDKLGPTVVIFKDADETILTSSQSENDKCQDAHPGT
jgi:hypothetical protein